MYHLIKSKSRLTFSSLKRNFSTSNQKKKLIYISPVWSEPTYSAASVRSVSLIELFISKGYEIHFFSPSKPNASTKKLEENYKIHTYHTLANDPLFDKCIDPLDPEIVIFDTFNYEEQFSWRVKKRFPEALLILDTQDLHFLRYYRQGLVRNTSELPEKLITSVPPITEKNVVRELSSIHRVDLVLLVSPFEKSLLEEHYEVPSHKLCLAPFFYEIPKKPVPSFYERKNFVFIGNFRHLPNVDSFWWLKNEIWPLIRAKLPNAQLHIYGSFFNLEEHRACSIEEGLIHRGFAQDAINILSHYVVNLACLRFGAGIKGKIADGFLAGTPCITTPIGSEGMTIENDINDWGGLVSMTKQSLVMNAVRLYETQALWQSKQEAGYKVIQHLFDRSTNFEILFSAVVRALNSKHSWRNKNITGAMLWYHGNRSTEYFSKYLETRKLIYEPKKLNE